MLKKVISFIVFLFFSIGAQAYDFSSVCSTGQLLYYSLTDTVNRFVTVTYPGPTIDSAYYGCDKPTGSLVIPSQVLYIDRYYTITAISPCAFAKCTGLDDMLEIPNTVESIGRYAFLHCGNIKELRFNPTNCRTAFAAFEGCSFKTVNICEGVTVIPEAAFAHNINIETLVLPESVTIVGSRAFFNCPNLVSVKFGTMLDTIGDYAFSDCPSLQTISPINAACIGLGAFCNDFSLYEVSMLDAVSVITEQVFFNCTSLHKIQLGASVSVIENNAFNHCKAIDTLYCFADDPPVVMENSFNGNMECCSLLVPCMAVGRYSQVFGWRDFGVIMPYEQVKCELVVNHDDYGSVICSDTVFCLGGEVEIEAVPNSSYLFEKWQDGNTENPRNVLLLNDTLFVAFFIIDTSFISTDDYTCKDVDITIDSRTICVDVYCQSDIRIFDVLGRCLYKSGKKENYCCYHASVEGVYFVLVENGFRKKILIQ